MRTEAGRAAPDLEVLGDSTLGWKCLVTPSPALPLEGGEGGLGHWALSRAAEPSTESEQAWHFQPRVLKRWPGARRHFSWQMPGPEFREAGLMLGMWKSWALL